MSHTGKVRSCDECHENPKFLVGVGVLAAAECLSMCTSRFEITSNKGIPLFKDL